VGLKPKLSLAEARAAAAAERAAARPLAEIVGIKPPAPIAPIKRRI